MSLLKKIYNFFNNPITALLIMLFFFIGYYLSIGLTIGFGNNFLSFGPTKDKNGEYIKFMGIEINSWKLVGIVYTIIFISTVLQTYYKNIMSDNINSFIWNKAVNFVPHSKSLTYLVLLIDPFINMLITIIRFYATATFQIQYVIPQFIASYLIDLPFIIKLLSSKKFIS